jgi:hypothetical protein
MTVVSRLLRTAWVKSTLADSKRLPVAKIRYARFCMPAFHCALVSRKHLKIGDLSDLVA